MAAAISVIKQSKMGTLRANIVDITLDASYPTGGYFIDPVILGIHSIDFVSPTTAGGHILEFTYPTSKLKVYRMANHAHTENTAAAYTQSATTNAAGQVAQQEVTAAASLAGIVVRALIIGV